MTIGTYFLMFADIWVPQTESDDLSFFVHGKIACQHHVAGKIGNGFVQINQPVLAGPEEGSSTQGACDFTHYLASVVDGKTFTVNGAGFAAQRLHSGGAGPDEGVNTSAALGSADDHSAVI